MGYLAASTDRSLWVMGFHALMMNGHEKYAAKIEPNIAKTS
jgi:hypothetical protein